MSILATLLSKKGQFASVKYQRPVKQLKTSPNQNVTKEVSLVSRAGVEYDSIKNVQEKRESGELPAENQGLTWGEWVEYPYLIKNKNELYARFTLGANNPPKITYKIDGKEVTKEKALEYALASERSDVERPDVITLNLKNIEELK